MLKMVIKRSNIMNKFTMEKAEDLSFDENKCTLSSEIRRKLFQYSDNNLVLDNGQMVLLNYPNSIKEKILDYCLKILIEFIESEKSLNQCYEIKNKYIKHEDDINNTNIYVKKLCDIIVNMDRANKYIWNISKLLVDRIESYKEYILWQEQVTNIEKDIRDKWDLVYDIRNEIEHPKNLKTTFFTRKRGKTISPEIIYNGINYDLLELSKNSLECVYIFFNTVMGASFLNSKYVIAFTDKERKILYTINKDKM